MFGLTLRGSWVRYRVSPYLIIGGIAGDEPAKPNILYVTTSGSHATTGVLGHVGQWRIGVLGGGTPGKYEIWLRTVPLDKQLPVYKKEGGGALSATASPSS